MKAASTAKVFFMVAPPIQNFKYYLSSLDLWRADFVHPWMSQNRQAGDSVSGSIIRLIGVKNKAALTQIRCIVPLWEWACGQSEKPSSEVVVMMTMDMPAGSRTGLHRPRVRAVLAAYNRTRSSGMPIVRQERSEKPCYKTAVMLL